MKRSIAFLLACCASFAAQADEGMWTFDTAACRDQAGMAWADGWLKRHASPRSLEKLHCVVHIARGLILTNHHCSASCNARTRLQSKTCWQWLQGRGRGRNGAAGRTAVLVDMHNVTIP
jgi:hypothetical protein